jgi:hypothetical protein
VASPNPQEIDPRPGSWGEKKVLGSAGKHVFEEFRDILQGKMPLQYQLPFKQKQLLVNRSVLPIASV